MITVELTFEEAETVAVILESFLKDLRFEVADTEKKEWRDKMKEEEKFIKNLIVRLRERKGITPVEPETPPIV